MYLKDTTVVILILTLNTRTTSFASVAQHRLCEVENSIGQIWVLIFTSYAQNSQSIKTE